MTDRHHDIIIYYYHCYRSYYLPSAVRSFRGPVHQRFVLHDFRLAGPPERQPLVVGRRRRAGRVLHGHRGLQRPRAARAVRWRVRYRDAHVGRGRLLLLPPVRPRSAALVQRQRKHRVRFGLWRRFADRNVHRPFHSVRTDKFVFFKRSVVNWLPTETINPSGSCDLRLIISRRRDNRHIFFKPWVKVTFKTFLPGENNVNTFHLLIYKKRRALQQCSLFHSRRLRRTCLIGRPTP